MDIDTAAIAKAGAALAGAADELAALDGKAASLVFSRAQAGRYYGDEGAALAQSLLTHRRQLSEWSRSARELGDSLAASAASYADSDAGLAGRLGGSR
jgi:hypothetical protein